MAQAISRETGAMEDETSLNVQPSITKMDENIRNANEYVRKDCRLIIGTMTDQLRISKKTGVILTCARFKLRRCPRD